jgi:hypothetical protein
VRLVGDTDIEKSVLTTSVTPSVWLSVPVLPVITSEYVPGETTLVVVTLSVDEPDVTTLVGVNAAVAPEGKPATLKKTFPANPDPGVRVTVNVAALPAGTDCEVGVAD